MSTAHVKNVEIRTQTKHGHSEPGIRNDFERVFHQTGHPYFPSAQTMDFLFS